MKKLNTLLSNYINTFKYNMCVVSLHNLQSLYAGILVLVLGVIGGVLALLLILNYTIGTIVSALLGAKSNPDFASTIWDNTGDLCNKLYTVLGGK